jgi:hypothetical protein
MRRVNVQKATGKRDIVVPSKSSDGWRAKESINFACVAHNVRRMDCLWPTCLLYAKFDPKNLTPIAI